MVKLNEEILKKHKARQEQNCIVFSDDLSLCYFGGAGTTYLYGLRLKKMKHFSVVIEALEEQQNIIAITSEEDNALKELINSGFKEIYSTGNQTSGRELKTMEYVYA